MNLRKIQNKKASAIGGETVIIFAIVIIVLIMGSMFLFRTNIDTWIKNLPSFQGPGEEDREIGIDLEVGFDCKYPIGRIVGSDGDRDIFLLNLDDVEDVGTDLTKIEEKANSAQDVSYLKWNFVDNKIFYDKVHFGEIELLYDKGVKTLIGTIKFKENVNSFIFNEWDKNSLNIAQDVKNFAIKSHIINNIKQDLKLLYNSKYHQDLGWLCGDPGIIESLKEAEKCVESCEIYGGECKETGELDEIEIQGINCPSGKCFVRKGTQNLKTKNLEMTKFSMSYSQEVIDLLELNEFGFSKLWVAEDIQNEPSGRGGRDSLGRLQFQQVSPRIEFNFEIESNEAYCYFIRTDERILYSGNSLFNLKKDPSFIWDDDEKENSIIFSTFNPSDKNAVFKTIFNVKEPLQFYSF